MEPPATLDRTLFQQTGQEVVRRLRNVRNPDDAFDVLHWGVRELPKSASPCSAPEATIAALLSVIAYFRISAPRAKEILREVEHAVAGWREAGHALVMSERDLESYADAFEHPERVATLKFTS
ncbi:MAG: hypothetical protein WC378_17990 [Opitutaceae bacterium]|jgi:hypothetical protein